MERDQVQVNLSILVDKQKNAGRIEYTARFEYAEHIFATSTSRQEAIAILLKTSADEIAEGIT